MPFGDLWFIIEVQAINSVMEINDLLINHYGRLARRVGQWERTVAEDERCLTSARATAVVSTGARNAVLVVFSCGATQGERER